MRIRNSCCMVTSSCIFLHLTEFVFEMLCLMSFNDHPRVSRVREKMRSLFNMVFSL